ncbi:MAG TPA: class I SAM-dependent methyltransferase [Rudaea sp.]|jgi:2-polyprenyl-3-methyl-5-hydroxy-6-metoxy-1,4-benzoquinol methylase|uniref:class I SAM-dependent methyltransferase n=1 Tax=Rudaea sp. TaxID=2136325 RepID=UPI002F932B18
MSGVPAATAPNAAALEFSGERFTPECVREIWYEHWHRYAFARAFARDKRVLDAACGEGYGSALLAGDAREVLGVDIAEPAIAHARVRYATHANLRFVQGDCTGLTLPDASVDLVVSFETLEHVAAQEALVAGFARVLTDDGVLIVSSPDKRAYSDASGFRNEFHVRELYREELLALLGAHFPFVYLYGQKLLFQSAIWALCAGQGGGIAAATATGPDSMKSGLHYDPLYFIAVCAQQPLNALPELALFGDREESVYQHYNHEVRKNIAAGGRIAELEGELATLRGELEQRKKAGAEP